MKTKIRRSQLLVIGCFFGFFLFCLVWGLAQPDRPSSAAENRSLAQRPAMRRVVTDFGGFARDFESYATDQFPDREQLIGVAFLPERTVAHLHGKIHDVLVGLQPFVVEGAVVVVQVKAASVAGVHMRYEIVHHRLSDLAGKRFPAGRPLRAVRRVRRSVARPLGDKRLFNRAADLLARQLQRANENVAGNVLDPRLRSG